SSACSTLYFLPAARGSIDPRLSQARPSSRSGKVTQLRQPPEVDCAAPERNEVLEVAARKETPRSRRRHRHPVRPAVHRTFTKYPYQASLAQNFRDGLWLRASVSRWASRGSRATRSLKVSLVMGDSQGGSELMVEPTRSWPGRSMSVAVLTHADRKNGRELLCRKPRKTLTS